MIDPEHVPEELRLKIGDTGPADIVVGIPSLNNAETITPVVRAVRECLRDGFSGARSVIVNADGGSGDDTVSRFITEVGDGRCIAVSYPLYPVQDLANPYAGVPGKGNALREIFRAASLLGARACAVIDPDFITLKPEWLRSLLEPVSRGEQDVVVPLYRRNNLEGTLAGGIVYPMTRALYGKCVRHPVGGDYCFSSAMIGHCLKQDIWDRESSRFGIDIWLATEAVSRRFRVLQVSLGEKSHTTTTPAPDLSRTLTRVMIALFDEMERNSSIWQRVRGSGQVPVEGIPQGAGAATGGFDVESMIEAYDLGVGSLFGFWGSVIPPFTLMELKKLNRRVNGGFIFPDAVWVRVVYDFAVAYHLRAINREHLLGAMTPLYLGWVASFLLEMGDKDYSMVENRVEELCLQYAKEKPYLISRWRWPDRFSP